MTERQLDPDSLLFQSFRHSQGQMASQVGIWRYMELAYGIEPNIDRATRDLGSIERFLSGANRTDGATHISLDETANLPAAVHDGMADLHGVYVGDKAGMQDMHDTTDVASFLAGQLLFREHQILTTWVPTDPMPEPSERSDKWKRLQARVKSGQASYLLHFGRDGAATGYAEFDALYADVWSQLDQHDAGGVQQLEQHVAHHELQILGQLCLGRV